MQRPLLSLGLMASVVTLALPAAARPELASGDQLLSTDVAGCLAAADQFIQDLGIEFSQGTIDRTGYFEDGVFRILCYGAGEEESLAVVFASHETSGDAVADFIQLALSSLNRLQPEAPSAQGLPQEN